MKYILFLSLLFVLELHAQVVFENGYFVNNQGNRIDCLIKNYDSRNNPKSFQYKLLNEDVVLEGVIANVQEFGITSDIRFIRAKVRIDKSPKLANTNKLNFHDETLFLKVLVDGDASLYRYREEGLNSFFFKTKEKSIEQLIYRKYYFTKNQIKENNHFRQQLLLDLTCNEELTSNLSKIEYDEKNLVDFFEAYNQCVDNDYVLYEKKKKKTALNFKIKAGVNFSNLELDQIGANRLNVRFDANTSFKIGFEGEFYFNFNRNKWSVFLESSFQKFLETTQPITGRSSFSNDVASLSYSVINISVGPRHHLYLNNDMKVFFNVLLNVSISQNSEVTFERMNNGFEIENNFGFGLGTGFSFKDKYNIEFRYNTPVNPLSGNNFWNGTFNNFSIIFGYTLFNTKK